MKHANGCPVWTGCSHPARYGRRTTRSHPPSCHLRASPRSMPPRGHLASSPPRHGPMGDVDCTGLRRHLAVFAGRPVCARSGGGTGSHCVPAARCASPGCSNTRMTADQPATTMWRLARFPQLQTISTNAWSRPGRCLTPCSHCSNPRYPRGHRTPRSSLQSASSTARKARSSMPSRHSGGRQSALAPVVMFVAALFAGYAAVRARRLELASAMHCGEPKIALWLQMLLETLMWCCSAIIVTTPLIVWALTHMETGVIISPTTLVGILARIPAAALVGVLAGARWRC